MLSIVKVLPNEYGIRKSPCFCFKKKRENANLQSSSPYSVPTLEKSANVHPSSHLREHVQASQKDAIFPFCFFCSGRRGSFRSSVKGIVGDSQSVQGMYCINSTLYVVRYACKLKGIIPFNMVLPTDLPKSRTPCSEWIIFWYVQSTLRHYEFLALKLTTTRDLFDISLILRVTNLMVLYRVISRHFLDTTVRARQQQFQF